MMCFSYETMKQGNEIVNMVFKIGTQQQIEIVSASINFLLPFYPLIKPIFQL